MLYKLQTLSLRLLSITIVICLVYAKSARAEGGVETLSVLKTYELARAQSEYLAKKQEDIKFADAKYKQAFAAVLPQIHGHVTQRFRDNSNGSGSSIYNGSFGNFNSNNNNNSSHPFQTAITLQQPIFSGFRDILLYKAAEAERTATEFDSRQAEVQLYSEVAESFAQVVLYEKDLTILADSAKVLSERITELQQFITLGKSRDSEELAARADLESVNSAEAQTHKLLAASREALAFLTGVPSEQLKLKAEIDNRVPAPLKDLLAEAEGRFDIKAAQARELSASRQETAAERERWPEISFEGSVYPYQDPNSSNDWDVFLRMDVPIFEGGAIDARVQQQQAMHRSAQLTLAEAKRVVERDVRTAYANFNNACDEALAFRKRRDANKKSLDSQRRDYKLGVVTNLDVLQSIKQLQDAERTLLAADVECRLNKVRLYVAVGSIP